MKRREVEQIQLENALFARVRRAEDRMRRLEIAVQALRESIARHYHDEKDTWDTVLRNVETLNQATFCVAMLGHREEN